MSLSLFTQYSLSYNRPSGFNDGVSAAAQANSEEFASLEEMSRRLLFGLTMTKNFFLFLRVPQRCSDEEETLFRFYVDTVLMAGWRRKQNEVPPPHYHYLLSTHTHQIAETQ